MTAPVMQATCAHGAPIVATLTDASRPVASIGADGCIAWHIAWVDRSRDLERTAREWAAVAQATARAMSDRADC